MGSLCIESSRTVENLHGKKVFVVSNIEGVQAMKLDTMDTDVRRLSGKRKDAAVMSTNEDQIVAEEREQSVRAQLEAAVEHRAQSGRVSRHAAADTVCREDPW